MDRMQKTQFDVDIAPPTLKDRKRSEMNQQSMQSLGGLGLIKPLKKVTGG